jgi:hypothetical protein
LDVGRKRKENEETGEQERIVVIVFEVVLEEGEDRCKE